MEKPQSQEQSQSFFWDVSPVKFLEKVFKYENQNGDEKTFTVRSLQTNVPQDFAPQNGEAKNVFLVYTARSASPATMLGLRPSSAKDVAAQRVTSSAKDVAAQRVTSSAAEVVARESVTPASLGSSSGVGKTETYEQRRSERYRLQHIASRCFLRSKEAAKFFFREDVHRTAQCRLRRSPSRTIEVNCNLGGAKIGKPPSRAYYTGLIRCASVWSCPVCAEQISEARRREVVAAVAWAYKNGHKCVLVTFTFPHYQFNTCKDLLAVQTKALRLLRGGKTWQADKATMGFVGLIRSLEVTRGDNGWHPHTHEIWIVGKKCRVAWLKACVLARWRNACRKVGLLLPMASNLDAFNARSVDIIDNAHASDYLTKQKDAWGIDLELTKPYKKTTGITPFRLLALAEKNIAYQKLYLEYSFAFRGKRQLFWSHGLKAKIGIKDVEDKEVCNEEKADVLATLTASDWDKVLAWNARAKILQIAECEGGDAVRCWLESPW